MSGKQDHLVCVGLGKCAAFLGKRLATLGWHVSGSARNGDKCAELLDQGFEVVVFDGTARAPALRELLGTATHLLLSAPPDAQGDPVLRHHGEDIAAAANLRWIGYLSTVGVYGDYDGDWVDEDAPLKPATERGKRRVDAERAWRDLAERLSVPLAIFRLAGIYGPSGNQLLSMRAGTAKRIVKPGQVFNRIHIADIATVLERSIAHPPAGVRAYNVCDDEPTPPQDVVAYAADLLGMVPPLETSFDEADLSAMARSFYADNKRCRNERIKQELGVELAFPTYREGLAALLREMKDQQ